MNALVRAVALVAGLPLLFTMAASLGAPDPSRASGSGGAPEGAPKWYLEHLEETMAHGGRTIADNSEYQSEAEPFDAYGLEWDWGVGSQSLRGRLFGLKDGKEVGDFWEFRTVWHPGAKEARAYQFGADGTFGSGVLRPLDGGGFELEQTFVAPDGSSRDVRHESFGLEGGGHAGSSFDRVDGEWQARRTYTWLPVPRGADGD